MAIKNYLFFLIYILLKPGYLKLLSKRIHIPTFIQYEWLINYKIGTLIDIGASKGHVSNAMHYLFPDAIIYAFEPIKKDYDNIKNKLKFRQIIIENVALSNKIGEADFYINNYSPASSLLPLSERTKKNIIKISKSQKTKVATTTLDVYFKNKKIKKNIFLKIDTQGSENLIFEGGKEVLKHISIINVETSFKKDYKNQCSFSDIYKILIEHGFIYLGNILESYFYPTFNPPYYENSIFIKNNFLKQTCK